jgi:hypothetical protein
MNLLLRQNTESWGRAVVSVNNLQHPNFHTSSVLM